MHLLQFFPEVTIMFADIKGFTAWSSSREPTQVFTLLENLYNAFDMYVDAQSVLPLFREDFFLTVLHLLFVVCSVSQNVDVSSRWKQSETAMLVRPV
jgi:Adenylate and Guanylate cyclase catalytic domain